MALKKFDQDDDGKASKEEMLEGLKNAIAKVQGGWYVISMIKQ